MIKLPLDNNFLKEIGLKDLSASEKENLLEYIKETLEIRIGERLTRDLPEHLLKEFLIYVRQKREDKALTWMKENVPHHDKIVLEEINKLKVEVKVNAAKILENSG